MQILSAAEIELEIQRLAEGYYLADPADLAASAFDAFVPPEDISTFDYSVNRRRMRANDGKLSSWRADLTPYAIPVMRALDNPNIRAVVVPKPARSGGTVVAENYLLKLIEFGPFAGCLWYLAGPNEVKSYSKRVFEPLFIDHPGVARKITAKAGTDGNTKTLKTIGASTIELAAIGAKTTTNRQEALIVFDEPDSYPADFRSGFMDTGFERGAMLGNLLKIFACSHTDQGWVAGIAQAWLASSKGIIVMPCAECGEWASPYPTKHWPDIPRFTLYYQRLPERSMVGDRIRMAAETAALQCPHCGGLLTEEQRLTMIDQLVDMHEGQTLDPIAGVIGEALFNKTWGLWWHAFIVKQGSLSSLAEKLEAAREHYERTGSTTKIKKLMIRTFNEPWEGVAGTEGLDSAKLRKRTKDIARAEEKPVTYRMGEIPDGVKFITAAVDPGGSKFDYMIIGWDLHRRRYVLDRVTIRTRRHADGQDRDIRPTKVQDDWDVLIASVIDRKLPFKSDPTKLLPVAVTFIDSGDGNASANAYEFARRMDRKRWGNWRKVRCIKGAGSPNAPQLSPTPSLISKDDDGKPVKPEVTLHLVGSHSLKVDVLESLGIDDESAGQWFFPVDYPEHAYDEFFNEPLVEGKFIRNGPNESLDLAGYNEAARQMLESDRETRRWNQERMPEGQKWSPEHLPIWAQPISIVEEGGDLAVADERAPVVPPVKRNIFERFDDLNRD